MKKSKLPTVKSLRNKLWDLCKKYIRLTQPNVCFTCGEPNLEGKRWHTGHFIKERKLPFMLKQDLRFLRSQCQHCNLRQNGNEGIYALHLLETEGQDYLFELLHDIRFHTLKQQESPLSEQDKRDFLLMKIDHLKKLLDNLQQ